MSPLLPRALKHPLENFTARLNDMDKSGVRTPSETGYEGDDSQTHPTVDLGAAEIVAGTEIAHKDASQAHLFLHRIYGITDIYLL